MEGNPDDPSEKPSVMDLVEATLSPHLRAAATAQQKSKRAEDEAAGRQFNGKWRLARNWNSQILGMSGSCMNVNAAGHLLFHSRIRACAEARLPVPFANSRMRRSALARLARCFEIGKKFFRDRKKFFQNPKDGLSILFVWKAAFLVNALSLNFL